MVTFVDKEQAALSGTGQRRDVLILRGRRHGSADT
jgi:hypothetical protein